MKVTTEELERCEVLMTVEIESQQEQKMLQKAAKRIAREVRIPGFRPGKAPYNVVVRRFGLEAIQQEVLEQSADKMIQDALEEAEIVPFAQITLDSIDWGPLTVKVKVPTEPKVELGNYKDIRLEFESVEVTDEDVDEALAELQEETATWNPVDRPTEIGDLVSMSVVEKDGDEVLSENESVEHELTPPEEHEGHDHPDFTTPLLGLSAGDEKTFTLTYPEEFNNERYAGKDITFEVEVLGVKEKEVDPLDDEFAKSVSAFETLDELKADIRENIAQQRENQKNIELGNEALEQLIENSEITWPVAFEDESIKEEFERQARQMRSYGLTMESFLQMQNKTKEEATEELREDVVNRLKRGLVLGEVAELENLDVSESEILEQAKLISDMSGGGDQLWRNILASQAQQNIIANDLLMNKTIKWLAAIAKGEEPTLDTEPESIEAEENDSDEPSASESADEVLLEEESTAIPEKEEAGAENDEFEEESKESTEEVEATTKA